MRESMRLSAYTISRLQNGSPNFGPYGPSSGMTSVSYLSQIYPLLISNSGYTYGFWHFFMDPRLRGDDNNSAFVGVFLSGLYNPLAPSLKTTTPHISSLFPKNIVYFPQYPFTKGVSKILQIDRKITK
jgi:hypothetical protein